MYQIDDKISLTYIEKIEQNAQNIAKHWAIDRVLADFGITVLGVRQELSMLEELKGDKYGDAYLIGAEPPYDIHIWTRADVDGGEPEDYWLNIGKLAIEGGPGPAGRSIAAVSMNKDGRLLFTFSDGSTLLLAETVKGDKGDKGADGKTPRITATAETGGVRITTYDGDGNTVNSAFVSNGKDGKGEPGKDGKNAYLNFIGTFANIAQADATQYQIGDIAIENMGSSTDFYICVGVPGYPEHNAWQQFDFSGGTHVYQNGVLMNAWDADTKLDKYTGATNSASDYYIYGVDNNGAQVMVDCSVYARPAEIVFRDAAGNIRVPQTGYKNSFDAIPKQYCDDKVSTINNTIAALEARINQLENAPGGGSSGSGGWNSTTSATGEALWLTLDPTKNYEMCLMSEHGMGDNTMCSQVFLLPKTSIHTMSVSNMRVYTTNVNYLDNNYWEVNYDPPADQYYVMFAYNGSSPSDIHNITAYYREM